MRLYLCALVTTTACGFGLADDTSGGADQLPITGAGPWQKLTPDLATPVEEPFVVSDPILEITEPALVARAGGGYWIYVSRESAAAPVGDTEIWRGELPNFAEEPSLSRVLAADLPWEAGHVGAPAIIDDGERLIMFYAGGTAIGRAESTDGGATWTKRAEPILTDAISPGIGFDGARWVLAFLDPTDGTIGVAHSTDGVAFTRAPEPILAPRADDVDAFDHLAVDAPAVAWLVEGTGRGHFALWYAGVETPPRMGALPTYAVGYAASWDGITWSRLAGNRPITAAPAGAPTAILDGNHGVLAFTAANGLRQSIGIALSR